MKYTFHNSPVKNGPYSLVLTAYSRVKKNEFIEHSINIAEAVKLINKIHCNIESNLSNIVNNNSINQSNGNSFYTTGFTTAIEGHINNQILTFGKRSAFYDYGDIAES
ncbi:hypothetical protein [Hymenobacter glacieicola]|uniref:DUF1508 domain-containing protein n=1 Tax=Hymenobacter glacieicola TaxID=1562124 RepID=A0ABQ1WJ42_9BACT|nr:hypothetical protein [Hymenobacter glacieicola]GGG32335.1 hypothetical protein GCM10011378_06050 [Hymenobacter glacieicola]